MADAAHRTNVLLAGLFRRQALVLVALLGLAIAGYQTLGWTVSFLSEDGALINTAGRQRMLSQRIVSLGHQAMIAEDVVLRRDLLALMGRAVDEMEAGHLRLVAESRRRGMSEQFEALYFGDGPSLDPSVRHFVLDSRRFMNGAEEGRPSSAILSELASMARVELITGLENLVGRYQVESRERVEALKTSALYGLALFSGVLLFSWFGVFAPMARRLREELAAHQEAEDQVHRIIESVGEGIVGVDREGKCVFVNQAALSMLGYDAQEMTGKNLHSLIHHSHPDGSPYAHADCPLSNTLSSGARLAVDWECFWDKQGKGIPIRYLSNPIYKDGNLVGAVVTFQDISEQMETKRSLQASEEIKSAILDAALDAIVTVDRDGIIVEFNPAAQRIFGYTADQALGREIADLIIPEQHRSAHRQGMARLAAGGESRALGQRLEMTGQHADGHAVPVELAITHLPGHGLFTGFIRDLTGQKQTEQALRRSQKLEAVGQLTGGIAHDFNNLLGIITGNLELLKKSVVGDEKAERRLETALKSTQRGADLTRRLLSFSRQEAAGGMEPTDVNEAVTGMRDMLQRALTQMIRVNTDLSTEAWPVAMNRGEFEDSLLNLSINARDAMPQGGVLTIQTANLTVEPEHTRFDPNLHPGDYVVVSISDTGCGISREIMDRIFEPFFTTKERGKGTGLGLSMVYGFARRSGGHVRVYSEIGLGTTFRLYLPRLLDAATVEPQSHAAHGVPEPPGGSETVLVVDDEPHLAEIAAEFLADLGYSPIVASSPAQAVALLETRDDIALLFSDVVMPGGLSGYDLAARAVARGRTRVLLTSGFTGHARMDGDTPRYPILSKPYGKSELARLVREILDAPPAIARAS